MALINFQAALYFHPKPDNSRLIARLGDAIPVLNDQLKVNLRPMDETSAKILRGDEALFEENGKQFFLLYDEEKVFYDTTEWSLSISFLDAYSQCNAVHVSPELTEPTKELTNFVWERFLGIIKALVAQTEPFIAQINGLDEEENRQLISPQTVKAKTLPEFFTPYTYLDQPLLDEFLADKLKTAGAYEVERFSSGWSLQFVRDFYTTPSRTLLKALREALTGKVYYKQTSVFED